MAILSFLVGSFVEAWAEFRTHKARVMMSLIGVALAVTALTGVAAVGAIAQQSITEGFEKQAGRPALLSIQAPYNPTTGEQATDTAAFDRAVAGAMERYGIDYWSSVGYVDLRADFPDGARPIYAQSVDPDWGPMHRMSVDQGRWFRDADADLLAPVIIVSEPIWQLIGSPDLRTHPTLTLLGQREVTAIIVGITASAYPDDFSAFVLPKTGDLLNEGAAQAADGNMFPSQRSYEAWVPPANADELIPRLQTDIGSAVGEGYRSEIFRQDYQQGLTEDPLFIYKAVIGGIAGLILLLGALGLLNITLVTVRTRIREIGIRRSFGATAGRVFFGVMMESVVATIVAGFVGVALAVLALKNPWVTDWIAAQGVQDVPPFPIEAAIFGLVAATAVGALAGLFPALIAVRVKPIDAIRL